MRVRGVFLGGVQPWLGRARDRRALRAPRRALARGRRVRAPRAAGPIEPLARAEHVSDVFWDPANTSAIEGRTRIGLGAAIEIWETRLRVDFALRDVLDERGSDLLGFPLPGRSLSVSLALQSD